MMPVDPELRLWLLSEFFIFIGQWAEHMIEPMSQQEAISTFTNLLVSSFPKLKVYPLKLKKKPDKSSKLSYVG